MAGRWDLDESRGSCPVLRETGGKLPRSTHPVAESFFGTLKNFFIMRDTKLVSAQARFLAVYLSMSEFCLFGKKNGIARAVTFFPSGNLICEQVLQW